MVPRWRFLATFLHPVFSASRVQLSPKTSQSTARNSNQPGKSATVTSVPHLPAPEGKDIALFSPALRHQCLRYTVLRETVCHHADPFGQTLTQQTSSPSGKMNGSRLRWSINLQWMIPVSGNQDSTYLDATGHSCIASGPRPLHSAHPVERSAALPQLTCALVANVKRCHILSTAAHSQSWRGAAAIALS